MADSFISGAEAMKSAPGQMTAAEKAAADYPAGDSGVQANRKEMAADREGAAGTNRKRRGTDYEDCSYL